MDNFLYLPNNINHAVTFCQLDTLPLSGEGLGAKRSGVVFTALLSS
jgi:hypothetical protein